MFRFDQGNRRWRAACRHRDRANLARMIAAELIGAHTSRADAFRITTLQQWLADERSRLHPRLFDAATRSLPRFVIARLATVSRELQELR